MPKIFQEEITTNNFSLTGYEKFDSLYQLYDIFKNPNYFFINLFFDSSENLTESEIESFILKTSQKYHTYLWVVRCEKKEEKTPKQAQAFQDINTKKNLTTISQYIFSQLKEGYSCIVHEIVQGQYPSNRLDWIYSFGIYYQNNLPFIEIYPATDASSIKWGKLTPIYLIKLDENFKDTTVQFPENIEHYREIKLQEWVEKFSKELTDISEYSDIKKLKRILIKNQHYIYNLNIVEKYIKETKKELIDIAIKYLAYAHTKNTPLKNTILHGSLLFNNRLIIWDISSNKRWLFLK